MNNRPDSGSAAYLRGLGVSPGIAVATAVLYRSRVMSTPAHTIGVDDAESEWDRLDAAKAATRRQLADLRERLGAHDAGGPQQGQEQGGQSFELSHSCLLSARGGTGALFAK